MNDSSLTARVAAAFGAAFSARPTHVARAPGRVNLIGDHTDYNMGFVLPMAIDRDCVALARARTDGVVRVLAVDLRKQVEWRAADDPALVRRRLLEVDQRWATYVLGVLACMASRHPAGFEAVTRAGMDLAVGSDVPLGSGLSSSASLEVSVATLLESMAGKRLTAIEKALACQRAEHEFAGVPCGIMDMLVSAAGVAGHALLIDCRSNSVLPAPLPAPDQALVVVINSNAKHELAGGEYAQRRAGCERAAMLLGVTSLRESQEDPVSVRGLPEDLKPLVRHVVGESHRVTDAFDALHRGQLDRFGRLMNQSHASLRDDYRVSCAELDFLASRLERTPGVFGARMTGGGFGGSVVALARPEAMDAIREHIPDAYRSKFGLDCTIMTPVASPGAGPVTL